ncbi:hypothetical protein ABB37_09180 [Leptomonas pyrrhocoris]|uniref:Uncharacterized protein n=1 Tax=Leptomonas pyrrhocoris TaxID=157538 RepID=A0A0N0VD30_LEPPY|nr:hypothetical protein ABB37_09180 [Leptomonas pyrrhocoris]KPA74521.1 hypothetical protein ABB37_09180 [Leptomonas pyrrhocoris]|eukprot:XP_015652960.1 hypothetical protein ABB37_09180 [Leptomonas pyrrhocoris]
MKDDFWTLEWAYEPVSVRRGTSPPPDLFETASDWAADDDDDDGAGTGSTEALTSKTSDANVPLYSFSSRVSPPSRCTDSYADWEASLTVAEEYWRSSYESRKTRTFPVAHTPSPSALYELEPAASDEDGSVLPIFSSPSPAAEHDSVENEAQKDALTSREHLPSGRSASGAHDASLSDVSTTLIFHGDFNFTMGALRQLGQPGSSGLLPPAAQKTTADDAAMTTAHGTLILQEHSTGYLLDWKPSSTLKSIQTSPSPSALLPAPGTLAEEPLFAAASAPRLLPSSGVPKAAGALPAFAPLRRSPASTSVDDTAGEAEARVKALSESADPPCRTAPTAPRRITSPVVSAGDRWSGDGRLALSRPPIVRGTAAVSAAQPKTPLEVSSCPAGPKKKKSSPKGVFEDNFMAQSSHSSDGTVDIEVPPSVALALQLRGTKHKPVLPTETTLPVRAVEVQCRSAVPPGTARPSNTQWPALQQRTDTPRRGDVKDVKTDASLQQATPPLSSSPPPSQKFPLLARVSASPSSWLLLDSSSEGSGTATSLTRMVETAEGSADELAITLRGVRTHLGPKPSPPRPHAASEKSALSPQRQRDDAGTYNNAAPSADGPQKKSSPAQKEDQKNSKKLKKPTSGLHRSISPSRGIPLAATAVASFYNYTENTSGSGASVSPTETAGSSGQLRRGKTLSLSSSSCTVGITHTPHDNASVKAPHCENGLSTVNREPLAEAHQTQHQNGYVDAIPRPYAAASPSHTANRPQPVNLREAAMQAFPLVPVAERFHTMGRVPPQTARRHSPVATLSARGASPPSTQAWRRNNVAGTADAPPQENQPRQHKPRQRAEALRLSLPPTNSDSFSRRGGHATRIMKVSSRLMEASPAAPVSPLSAGKPQPPCTGMNLREPGGNRGGARRCFVSFPYEAPEKELSGTVDSPSSSPARESEKKARGTRMRGNAAVEAHNGMGAPARRASPETFCPWKRFPTDAEKDGYVNWPEQQLTKLSAGKSGATSSSTLGLSSSSILMGGSAPGVSLSHHHGLSDVRHKSHA